MASKPHNDYGLLWRALVISLLVHAILLLQPGFDQIHSNTNGGTSMLALLKPKSVTTHANAQLNTTQPKHSASRVIEKVTAKADSSAESTSESTQSAVKASEGVQVNTAGNPGKSSPIGPGTTSVSEMDSTEDRKSYLFAIAAEARRVKKYPPRAFAAGWTGTAEIRVTVTKGGAVQSPQLQKSSGYNEIDNAALSLIAIALKHTPLPDSLRSHPFEFIIPVSFNINDE